MDYGTRGPPTPDSLSDRALMYRLYVDEGLSQTAIADRLGCGSSTVSRWLDHHDIPTRNTGARIVHTELTDADWLHDQHVEQHKSVTEIAHELGCHRTTVLHWVRKHDIPHWEHVMRGEECPAYVHGEGYEPNQYGPLWYSARQDALSRDDYACTRCGMSRDEHIDEVGSDLDVHHITPYHEFDEDAEAHELSNLTTLCRGCHMTVERGTR